MWILTEFVYYLQKARAAVHYLAARNAEGEVLLAEIHRYLPSYYSITRANFLHSRGLGRWRETTI